MERSYNQGDVVVLKFPYSDEETSKVRPALILSNSFHNLHKNELIVCAISTNITRQNSIFIECPEHAGLDRPSIILPTKIASADKRKMHKKIGRVHESLLDKTLDELNLRLKKM